MYDASNNLHDYLKYACTKKAMSKMVRIQKLIESRGKQAIASEQTTKKHGNFVRKRTPNIRYY